MKYILPIVMTVIIILPGFNLAGFPIKFEDFLILGVLLYTFNERKGNFFFEKDFSRLILLFFLFIISNFISLLIAVIEGYNYTFQDINTILLYFKSCVFLIGGYFIGSKLRGASTNYLLYSLVFGLVISSTLSIIQYFDVGGLGRETYLLYAGESRILYGVTRAVGALNNPNYASYFHSIGFILALNIQTVGRKATILKYTLLVIAFLGVILAFSRTGIFVLLLVWFITLLLQGKIKKVFSIAFALVITVVFYFDTIFKNSRFGQILDSGGAGNISNLGNRSNLIWKHKLQIFYEHPLLGIGPAKNEISGTSFGATIYDNVYLLLLVTTGLIGFTLYLLLFYNMSKPFIQNKLRYNIISNTIIPIFILTLLFFMTTDLVWSIQFVAYFHLIVGVFYSYSQSSQDIIYS